MSNLPQQRNRWLPWIFLGLLGPLALGLVMMVGGEDVAMKRGGEGATTQVLEKVQVERGTMLAAGDGRTMWVVHPTVMKTIGEGKVLVGHELFATTNGGVAWRAIRNEAGLGFFSDHATALALVGRPREGGGAKGYASAYVFSGQKGTVRAVGLSGEVQPMRPLPPGEKLLAVTGTEQGVLALTHGEEGIRLYRLQGEWKVLAAMDGEVPGTSAKVSLAAIGGRLIVMWWDADQPGELVVRGLKKGGGLGGGGWSKAVTTELGKVGRGDTSRLMPVVVDETLYVLWASEEHGGLVLRGGWIVTNGGELDLKMLARNMLPIMELEGTDGLRMTDVSVAAVENSIGVVVNNADGAMVTYVFDGLGRKVSGPTPMKVVDPRGEMEFSQNVKMFLLAVLLGLSLWRWPTRRTEEGGEKEKGGGLGTVVLPEGMTTASMTQRGAAFLIDVLATFVITYVLLLLMQYAGWTSRPIGEWAKTIFNFDELLRAPELMAFWAVYSLHVMAGELMFQRSLGKACVGIRVMMTDGTSPTPGAIVTRNLIRLPELLLWIFVFYLLFSRGRQRLGDLVGKTMVVGTKSAEEK